MNPTDANQPDEEHASASLANYRKRALEHYKRSMKNGIFNVCAVCGFGIQAILEIAHLSQNRKDNSIENLAVLCPNCHKMHDIGLIPSDVVRTLRDQKVEPNWRLRIKDAGAKAALTRKQASASKRRCEAGKKAWAARSKSRDADNPSEA